MWGSKGSRRSARINTLIGEQALVQGDLRFGGGLHVEGRIQGNVSADDDDALLTLGEQGVIEGDVTVPQMVLNGTVHGDVHASQRLELAPRARVNGDVHYLLLEMAIGAEVNGKLVHEVEGEEEAGDDLTPGAPVADNT